MAGKAIEIGGKEGALFLGKRVAVDCISYAASYSSLKLAEQKGLYPRANILISLGIGLITTKGIEKFVFKDVPKTAITDTEGSQSEDERKYDVWNKLRSKGLDLEKENDILLTNKGLRPEPSTYLSRDYINEHLAQFKNGVSIVMTRRNYEEFVLGKAYIGYSDNTQFVLPKSLCDEISARAKGNIAEYERSLGFDADYFKKGGGLIRIDIDDISDQDLRIPSGNETGANSHWKPGGFTDGGIPEAISNLIPNTPSKATITEIDVK